MKVVSTLQNKNQNSLLGQDDIDVKVMQKKNSDI